VIVIDGSSGEGGGQILRTALALAAVTGKPFLIENIRARRPKPGLMRQHMTAVAAAQKVCSARVEGLELGAGTLTFTPGPVRAADYRFAVGTAGSAPLVLQTVLLPLLLCGGRSSVVLEGGTHNAHAPPFDFLERAFFPLLRRMGAAIDARLERLGFHPAGGGRFVVTLAPARSLASLDLTERGALLETSAEAVVARLPRHIAERELAVVAARLGWPESSLHLREESRAFGPGNFLVLTLRFQNVTEAFTAIGERGLPAELVADRAVEEARQYLAGGGAVGSHLADQLLLPLALGAGGIFTTLRPSSHTRTNAAVIRQFLPVHIGMEQVAANMWQIAVRSGD
jgi:RNA 3'-terminal phosphate cyclase (ATP)